MAQIEKLIEKFFSRPARNDITFNEITRLAEYYKCIVKSGGKHPIKVIDIQSGTIVVIPRHGKCAKEAYILQLAELFKDIEARNQ